MFTIEVYDFTGVGTRRASGDQAFEFAAVRTSFDLYKKLTILAQDVSRSSGPGLNRVADE